MPIPLPPISRLNELFILNPKSGELSRKIGVQGAKKGAVVGSKSKKGYLKVRIDNVYYYVHRVAFFMYTGLQPMTVDHRDRDRANNRLFNLRGR